MIITSSTWAQLPADALIVGPSGRVWQVAGYGTAAQGPYVDLRDPETDERNSVFVNPADPVQHLATTRDPSEHAAVLALSKAFPGITRIP